MQRPLTLAWALACVSIVMLLAPAAHGGYTHYFTWKQPPENESAQLTACVAAMKRVLDDNKAILAGPDGTGAPVVTAAGVEFNGVGTDSYETFVFPGQMGFNFCKTEYQPYDKVVVACLFVARDFFPVSVLEVASDGRGEDDDAFAEGRTVFQKTFGRDPPDLFNGSPGAGGALVAVGGASGGGRGTTTTTGVGAAARGAGLGYWVAAAMIVLAMGVGGVVLARRASARGQDQQ